MLRYDRQTKPGLVALYDIRPGNGAGPFLQPRNPRGAGKSRNIVNNNTVYAFRVYSQQQQQQETTTMRCCCNWSRQQWVMQLTGWFNDGRVQFVKLVVKPRHCHHVVGESGWQQLPKLRRGARLECRLVSQQRSCERIHWHSGQLSSSVTQVCTRTLSLSLSPSLDPTQWYVRFMSYVTI